MKMSMCIDCGRELLTADGPIRCSGCRGKEEIKDLEEALRVSEEAKLKLLEPICGSTLLKYEPKYEYMLLSEESFMGEQGRDRNHVEDILNRFGDSGWELVPILMFDTFYVFKRLKDLEE